MLFIIQLTFIEKYIKIIFTKCECFPNILYSILLYENFDKTFVFTIYKKLKNSSI